MYSDLRELAYTACIQVKTMLFSIAFIFCLFFVTAVGRTPLAGEIVEIRTPRLDAYVSCHYTPIPRSPSQTLPAFYSMNISTLRSFIGITIVWQFLYPMRGRMMSGNMEVLSPSYRRMLHRRSFHHISGGM